jgi:hypothetical protein
LVISPLVRAEILEGHQHVERIAVFGLAQKFTLQ